VIVFELALHNHIIRACSVLYSSCLASSSTTICTCICFKSLPSHAYVPNHGPIFGGSTNNYTWASYLDAFPLTAQERAWVWGYSNTWTQSSQSVAGERSSTGDMCCWDCWSVSGYKLQEETFSSCRKILKTKYVHSHNTGHINTPHCMYDLIICQHTLGNTGLIIQMRCVYKVSSAGFWNAILGSPMEGRCVCNFNSICTKSIPDLIQAMSTRVARF